MEVMFSSIVNKNYSQIIVIKIMQAVETGELKEGEKLPSELELSSMFGVSRSPVRDAIRILIGMGCLRIIPGKGTFICRKVQV